MAQIECKDVSVKYESQEVLKDISFSIEAGDYLCIVGENGSGKSTLVKTILGLENTKTGEVIFGDNLNKNEIGYLPQQTQAQKDFPASVYEVVLSGCLNSRGINPFYSYKDKKLANEMIKSLGIENIKKKSFRELSGGQQQRVLLARALCATKKIIILDEPITCLLYTSRVELAKPGMTICKNTVSAMQAGIIYGYAGMVERLIDMIKKELGSDDVKVIATGGLSTLIDSETDSIDYIDKDLTLEGLKLIYEKNKE